MRQLVPIKEVYVEALQVKHPIIDWEVHTEGQRAYWKITRLGGSSASYQFFIDLLKHLDRDDLNQLWSLMKETFTEWKLYDKCGVHQLTSKDKDIFMLVEKDYPLRKGLALVMICYKLQVENYSQMADDLVRKIYNIANSLRQQEVSGRDKELKEIKHKDTSPSENTSENPIKVEGFEHPQEEFVPIRRSARTHQAPDRLCLNVEVEEHSLGDLNEPTNYKAAILDLKSDKRKWLFKKKTNMDGIVHIYKAHLVAKGYTQTYGVDYEETFSPVADIRAIRILIAIAAFYDYEIWQMNESMQASKIHYGLKQASRSWNKRFDAEIKRMDTSKRKYIPMKERLNLNKTQGASTPEEVKRIQNIPYASAVGSIMYADGNTMTQIRLDFGENTSCGKEKANDSGAGGSKDEELQMPFKKVLRSLFTQMIIEFSAPKHLMPTNLKVYYGSIDPDDRIDQFIGASNQGKWYMLDVVDSAFES
nr:hypothetical protein [Tanacetum cinerariifolium]